MATRVEKKRPKSSSKRFRARPRAAGAKLTYRDVAWWAETIDGSRDEDLVIAEVPQNGSVKSVVKKRADVVPGRERILFDGIRAESKVPDRAGPAHITIEVAGKTIECKSDDGEWCDSVFCTESAIEKFLFPYYHTQRLLTDQEWKQLQDDFMKKSTVAIGHVHPSHTETYSFYGLTMIPGRNGARPKVTWEKII